MCDAKSGLRIPVRGIGLANTAKQVPAEALITRPLSARVHVDDPVVNVGAGQNTNLVARAGELLGRSLGGEVSQGWKSTAPRAAADGNRQGQ